MSDTVNLINIDAKIKHMIVKIEGDGDLVLNKMNARNERMLKAPDRKTIKEVPNMWEDIITSIHWRDPINKGNLYETANEEMMHELIQTNAPCITAFGLKKSFGDAVVRNEIDKYKTKLDNALNVIAQNGLIPIQFESWSYDTRLMSPKKGSPLTVYLNHFHHWSAEFQIDYLDHVYSRDQILNFINLSGFGGGIGSGRTSGYGRYHIVGVAA